MTAVCPVCEREQGEGLLCHACTSMLEYELGDVPAIVAELDITLSRQARIGGGGKGGKGGAHEKTPVNLGALRAADDLANTLTTWARDVCGEYAAGGADRNPSVVAAHMLLSEMPMIRKHPAVDELVDEITDTIRQARHAVDRPADRQFLGPCYGEHEGVTCEADLTASPGARVARCKVCGHEVDVAERRAWLLNETKDRLFTVKEAAQMMGDVGHIRVTEASIRGYIHRKRIAYHAATMIRLGDLLAVVLDDGEKRTA